MTDESGRSGLPTDGTFFCTCALDETVAEKKWKGVVPGLLFTMISLFPGVALASKSVTYYYTDPQGSIVAATDEQGNMVESRDFRPYGGDAPLSGSIGNRGYAGHVEDDESDLVYMQARYYDPTIGRFLNVDIVLPAPAALDLINRYAYVANNPMTLTDPFGMFPQHMSSSDLNCEVYHCDRTGGSDSGNRSDDAMRGTIPANTPPGMVHYFGDSSANGRIKAAGAVMDYFNINYGGIRIIYVANLTDSNANAAIDQWGTLSVGPDLYTKSFGLMGAILSHEVEGHWLTQMFRNATLKQDSQSSWMREVQAYDMELSQKNIARFGLSPQEVDGEMKKRSLYFNGLNDANKSMIRHRIYKPLGD